MMRTDSIKRSSSNEPDGAEIVYLKDNVAIHPTQFVSERISGRSILCISNCFLFLFAFVCACDFVISVFLTIVCDHRPGCRTKSKTRMLSR